MINSPRSWIVGTAVLAVLLIVGSWFFLIAPQRHREQELRTETTSAARENEQLAEHVAELRRQFVDLPAKQQELAVLRQHLPTNFALSTLTRQLNALATASGVSVDSIAPSPPVASAAGNSGNAVSGLVTSELTVQVKGTLPHVEVFLQQVQDLQRDVLVSGVSLTADGASGSSSSGSSDSTTNASATDAQSGSQLTATITGTVFVLPATAAATTAASATPSATTAP